MALRTSLLLDESPDLTFDRFAHLGALQLKTPIVLIWLADRRRQFIKAAFGVTVDEAAHYSPFCASVLTKAKPTIVCDLRSDEDFCNYPLVHTGEQIRFFAGAPLLGPDGSTLGSYCAFDFTSRDVYASDQQSILAQWAAITADAIERRTVGGAGASTRDELTRANERYVLATRATTDGIWDWDCASNEVYYSNRWRAVVGLTGEEHHGSIQDWIARLHPSDALSARQIIAHLQTSDIPTFESEHRIRHEDGSWRWIHNRGIAIRNGGGELIRLAGAIRDITAERMRDSLTGLHSRVSLLSALEERLQSTPATDRTFALLLIGLAKFKRINDSFGHAAGDFVLAELGNRMAETTVGSPTCVAARLAGDEFAILLSDIAHEEDARTYAHCIEYLLEVPIAYGAQLIHISASIGIALGSLRYERSEDILHDADTAMFEAKTNVAFDSVVFTHALRERAKIRMTLESELRGAIDRKELLLHYQPKVLLETRQITGFEALIRWQHPERGLILPNSFIPVAEESDLILEIGRWTLRESIRQLSEWRARGLVSPTDTVAVNLSAKQFGDRQLVENIVLKLTAHNLPSSSLELEITEGILISDAANALGVLQRLKAVGVGLDLDDFGTGYSSLSYLQRFPFDSLKIDRSFIQDIHTNESTAAITQAIVALGRALGLRVVAEGIETSYQARKILAMGCRHAQGYLFSKPLPAAGIESLLKRRSSPLLSRTVCSAKRLFRVA